MDYPLARLGSREFEQLLQSLCKARLGPRVEAFGDGPDGGRDAVIRGRIIWSEDDVWDGYTIMQAKFRQRLLGTDLDTKWFTEQVEGELKNWVAYKSRGTRKRRVKEWKRTGIRPAVAVWTPAQLAQFLAFIRSHRLFAMFQLIAMRGLRRGEACGLKWEDLDLDEGLAYLSRQIQEGTDGRLRACPLKTESSCRAVAMAPQTVTVLRAHHSWQSRWLSESGIKTQGWVFTDEIGRPLSPTA